MREDPFFLDKVQLQLERFQHLQRQWEEQQAVWERCKQEYEAMLSVAAEHQAILEEMKWRANHMPELVLWGSLRR